MTVQQLNPLRDPRWQYFLREHPEASIFHAPGWLDALRRTFGFEPVVLTTSPPGGAISNGVLFCLVRSRLTGCRLVSLPFSDHCEPLLGRIEDFRAILDAAVGRAGRDHLRFVEIRPRNGWSCPEPRFGPSDDFWFHTLDLSPGLGEIYRRFHKDCVQRKIRRAEREGLAVEAGRSQHLLREFYRLMVRSRRRFRLPPQPLAWFHHLIDTMGEDLEIALARKEGRPVAGMLTLKYKDVLLYKYGCSDPSQNPLGGMHLLFWRAIRQAKELGMRQFEFGRSDLDNVGLATFKDRWGCVRSRLRYWRSPADCAVGTRKSWIARIGGPLVARVPAPLLPAVGKLVARHLG